MIASLLAFTSLLSPAPLTYAGSVQFNPGSSFSTGSLPFQTGYIVYSSSDVVDMRITYREDNRREDADLIFYRKAHSLWPTGDPNPIKLTWISPSGSEYKAAVFAEEYTRDRNSRAKFLPQEFTERMETFILTVNSYRKAFFSFSPPLAGHILEIFDWEPGIPPELTTHPYFKKLTTSQGEKQILRLHDFKDFLNIDGSIPIPVPVPMRYQSQITVEIIKRYDRPRRADIKVGTGATIDQFDWADVELVKVDQNGTIIGEVEAQRVSPFDIASVSLLPNGGVECLAQVLPGMKEGGVRNVSWPDGTFQQVRLIKVYPKTKWVDRFDG